MWPQDGTYLTFLSDTMAACFVCRRRDCRWYGLNHEWLEHATSYHFRCPKCRMAYEGFKDAGGAKLLPGNKVLATWELGAREVNRSLLAWWKGENQVEEYLAAQMEITYANLRSTKDLKDWRSDCTTKLSDLLERYSAPAVFRKFEWDHSLDYITENSPGFHPSQYTRLQKEGFHGAIFSYKEGCEVFRDWDLLAGIMAGICLRPDSGNP